MQWRWSIWRMGILQWWRSSDGWKLQQWAGSDVFYIQKCNWFTLILLSLAGLFIHDESSHQEATVADGSAAKTLSKPWSSSLCHQVESWVASRRLFSQNYYCTLWRNNWLCTSACPSPWTGECMALNNIMAVKATGVIRELKQLKKTKLLFYARKIILNHYWIYQRSRLFSVVTFLLFISVCHKQLQHCTFQIFMLSDSWVDICLITVR